MKVSALFFGLFLLASCCLKVTNEFSQAIINRTADTLWMTNADTTDPDWPFGDAILVLPQSATILAALTEFSLAEHYNCQAYTPLLDSVEVVTSSGRSLVKEPGSTENWVTEGGLGSCSSYWTCSFVVEETDLVP